MNAIWFIIIWFSGMLFKNTFWKQCITFFLVLQVALRIRPLSDAELEEGATIIAHKMDDQVRANRCISYCVCGTESALHVTIPSQWRIYLHNCLKKTTAHSHCVSFIFIENILCTLVVDLCCFRSRSYRSHLFFS